MGLDIVELVQMLENKFGFELDRTEAKRIRTVGQLAKQVALQSSNRQGTPNQIEEEAYQAISTFIIQEFHVRPELIHHDAKLVDDLGLD